MKKKVKHENNNLKKTVTFIIGLILIIPQFVSARSKYWCSDFSTCSQAQQALRNGATYLDRDGDGIPCETLCSGRKQAKVPKSKYYIGPKGGCYYYKSNKKIYVSRSLCN